MKIRILIAALVVASAAACKQAPPTSDTNAAHATVTDTAAPATSTTGTTAKSATTATSGT